MKNSRKVISKVLVMVLIMNFLLPSGIAQADIGLKYLSVNHEILEFKEIIYVDGTKGNDSGGDGSKKNPFQSVVKAFDYMAANCKQNGAIVIADGEYDVSSLFKGSSYNLNARYNQVKLSIFAETMGHVTLKNYHEWIIVENNSSYRIKLRFYGIKLDGFYTHLGGDDWVNEYYNCMITKNYGGLNYFIKNAAIKIENCLFTGAGNTNHYKQNPASGVAINSASTTNDMDPYAGTKTNVLYNVSIDENYHITSDGWQNTGDGYNPDGTKSHIGVYGGPFAWGSKVIEFNTNTSKLKIVLEPGETLRLSIDRDLSENNNAIWTSSDPDVAYAAPDGFITALKKGNTSIYVNQPDGTADSYNVLVLDDASEYRLAVDLSIGESCRLTIDDYSFTQNAAWNTKNSDLASVTKKGRVTALATGLALVTATDEQNQIVGQIYIRVRN